MSPSVFSFIFSVEALNCYLMMSKCYYNLRKLGLSEETTTIYDWCVITKPNSCYHNLRQILQPRQLYQVVLLKLTYNLWLYIPDHIVWYVNRSFTTPQLSVAVGCCFDMTWSKQVFHRLARGNFRVRLATQRKCLRTLTCIVIPFGQGQQCATFWIRFHKTHVENCFI